MSVDYTGEREALAAGCTQVCGVDEAGAGPLMGPVYAAAVILPADCVIEGLDDSKKLTEKKRFLTSFVKRRSHTVLHPSTQGRSTRSTFSTPA